MSRSVALGLLTLSLALVVLPLAAPVPGMPATLKADEPAYFLAALSLAHDRDLDCDERDLQRLFDAFPYLTTQNLILGSDDGWHRLFYAKPYLYSLLAAPWAALLGPAGMVALNMLMLAAMIWMGADYLRTYNDDALAALFAAGFFLLSTAHAYVYWLHPEVFMMLGVTGCLYFGLHVAALPELPRRRGIARLRDPRLAPALSAICLAAAIYHKPTYAAFALPVLLALALRRRWRAAVAWCVAAALAVGLFAAGSWLLIDHPTPYLGVARAGFAIDRPDRPPVEPIATATPQEGAELAERTAGWWWIFYLPDLVWADFAEDLRYFFVGRHTGLFVYQPFALLALLLFVLAGRRDRGRAVRWALLVALAAVALFFLLWISFNWHGGGGFVGNRYFVVAYPGFLFLITRIRPPAATLAGYAAGGLLLGPLLLAPYGAPVPQPTLQAHARGRPHQVFPYELSLREIPGHHGVVIEGVWFRGRKDQIKPVGDTIWIQGGDRAELWLQSETPLTSLVFELESPVDGNAVSLRLADARAELRAGPAPQRVVLRPSEPSRVRLDLDLRTDILHRIWAYRLVVETATGELPAWRDAGPRSFYLGAVLTYRGAEPDAGVD